MQKYTPPILAARRSRHLQRVSFVSAGLLLTLVACGGGSPSLNSPESSAQLRTFPGGPVTRVATNYSVVNLTSSGFVSSGAFKGMNSSGQVVFGESADGIQKAYFYDGSRIRQFGAGAPIMPASINDAGQVTGWRYPSGGFVWTPTDDSFVDIGVLPEATLYRKSIGIGINNLGQVTGASTIDAGPQHDSAILWTPNSATGGTLVNLGKLEGHATSTGYFINDAGDVLGKSDDRIVVWSPTGSGSGKMIDITPPGVVSAYGSDMNEQSHLTLNAWDGSFSRAFRWSPTLGQAVDIGHLGRAYTHTSAMNNAGQIVGSSATLWSGSRAFIWTPTADGHAGSMVSLGNALGTSQIRFSTANDINQAGLVVGSAVDSTGEQRAFAWSEVDGMVDLNTRMIGAPEGLMLSQATHVSDNGSIVAQSNVGYVSLKPEAAKAVAPAIGPIQADDPVRVGLPMSVIAEFTDADVSDTHRGTWSWGDGSFAEPAAIQQASGSGSASGAHNFASAGIYDVMLEVVDSAGKSARVSRQTVVFDPAAGFVVGGGWFMSPPGAYKPDQMLTDRASFGFVSKYHRGAEKPSGNTEFQFRAAGLNFRSSNYDWLVISGARAQYKGSGTINGEGDYQFMLTAVDGALLGGASADRFRMKIWQYDAAAKSDRIIYDNLIDATGEGGTNEGSVIGGGSIVIQR